MPFYEFQCDNCVMNDQSSENARIELLLSLSEVDVPQPCPTCNNALKRLISAPHGVVSGSSTPCRLNRKRNK